MSETLLVSRRQIVECITFKDVLEVVEEVYAAHGRGEVSMPAKITLDMKASGEPNWSNAMPAYLPGLNAAGIKWAGGYLHNGERRNLDYVQAMLILNDPISGLPLAIMDAGAITTMRTGATAAVAARWLAQPKNGQVVMFGAGAQGRSTARSMQAWCPWVKRFTVVDVRPETAEAFVSEMQTELDFEVAAAVDVAQAVKQADVVVTATTANQALVKKAWVQPGTLIVTLGSYQELEPSLVLEADTLLVDDRRQCLHRGELVPLLESNQLDPEDVNLEIGEVVAGTKRGRASEDDIVVADLIGLGSIDIACARRVFEMLVDTRGVQTFSFY